MLRSVGIPLDTQDIKCIPLKNKLSLVMQTLINVNPFELHYFPLLFLQIEVLVVIIPLIYLTDFVFQVKEQF